MNPAAIVALVLASTAATLYAQVRAARLRRWARRWLRRTAVYKHRFGPQAGHDRHYRVAYVGMTNSPRLRGGQHAAGSWWHPLTDPGLYVEYWYRTRIQAALAEKWAIHRHCPVGNIQHNRRYRQQTGEREFLRITAGAIRNQEVSR